MRLTRNLALLAICCLQACEQRSPIDEFAVQRWASSTEVVSRKVPSSYSHQVSDGQFVVVAAGDFKETPDGIDLESMTPLPKGFYVFPGKIFVSSIDEAIRVMRRINPKTINQQAEQADAGNRAKPGA